LYPIFRTSVDETEARQREALRLKREEVSGEMGRAVIGIGAAILKVAIQVAFTLACISITLACIYGLVRFVKWAWYN